MINLSFETYVGIATIVGTGATIITMTGKNISLRRKTKKFEKLNPSLEVLSNFDAVCLKVTGIFTEELKIANEFKIRNIGLDLEKMLPYMDKLVETYIKGDPHINFSYKGLIINPQSADIRPLINGTSNIRDEYVTASLSRLKDSHELYKNNLNIRFEVKSYDLPPVIHGLIINKKHLFLGFTEFKDKKLFGSDCPYIYLKFDRSVVATSHYFSVFIDWFNYYWENGK